MIPFYPFSPVVDQLVELALLEDLCNGDLTSDSLFSEGTMAQGVVLAKSNLRVAGLGVFIRVMKRIDDQISITLLTADGDEVEAGTVLAALEGPAKGVLRAERTALNFLCHLSGVATITAAFVNAAGEKGPRICDTRKTTPGFRELEKYAVRMGGGRNHRINLGAAAMIKDNHIAAMGSIARAVQHLKRELPHTAKIEVEISSLEQLEEALDTGADILMFDNMSATDMREAVARCQGRVLTEASGGVTLSRMGELRETGIDVVSIGALTHSAPAADISLEMTLA